MSKSWTPRNSQTSSNQHPAFFRLSPSVFWLHQSCVASPEVFMSLAKDLRQRKDCECTRSTDIGQYTLQCPHGCALGQKPRKPWGLNFKKLGMSLRKTGFYQQQWGFFYHSKLRFHHSKWCFSMIQWFTMLPGYLWRCSYFVLSPANGMMISSDFHRFGMVEGNADGYLAKMFFCIESMLLMVENTASVQACGMLGRV